MRDKTVEPKKTKSDKRVQLISPPALMCDDIRQAASAKSSVKQTKRKPEAARVKSAWETDSSKRFSSGGTRRDSREDISLLADEIVLQVMEEDGGETAVKERGVSTLYNQGTDMSVGHSEEIAVLGGCGLEEFREKENVGPLPSNNCPHSPRICGKR